MDTSSLLNDVRQRLSRVARPVQSALGTNGIADTLISFVSEWRKTAGSAEERAAQRHEDLVARLTRLEAGKASPNPAETKEDTPLNRSATFALPNGKPYRLALSTANPDSYRLHVASSGAQEADWRLCLAWLRPDDVFFDVGANIGAFTIPAAVLRADVHAFELLSENVDRILDSAKLNEVGRLHLTLGAVWHSAGVVGYGGLSAWGHVQPAAQTMVAALRLDDYITQRSLMRVDMIKLDVEGAEMAALNGASHLIERDHPDILVESNTLTCGESGYSYRDLLRWLTSHGYTLFRVAPDVLHPWSHEDVQEVVQTDYLATTRSPAEITRRCGWPIRPLSEPELVANILGEARYGEFHHLHLLAIRKHLPTRVRLDDRVATLMDSWGHLSDHLKMESLRIGTSE